MRSISADVMHSTIITVNSLGPRFFLRSFLPSRTHKHTQVSVLLVVGLKAAPVGNFSHL